MWPSHLMDREQILQYDASFVQLQCAASRCKRHQARSCGGRTHVSLSLGVPVNVNKWFDAHSAWTHDHHVTIGETVAMTPASQAVFEAQGNIMIGEAVAIAKRLHGGALSCTVGPISIGEDEWVCCSVETFSCIGKLAIRLRRLLQGVRQAEDTTYDVYSSLHITLDKDVPGRVLQWQGRGTSAALRRFLDELGNSGINRSPIPTAAEQVSSVRGEQGAVQAADAEHSVARHRSVLPSPTGGRGVGAGFGKGLSCACPR